MKHNNVVRYRRGHRKGVSKFLWLLLLTFATAALTALYLVSPLALVDHVEVLGNDNLGSDDILAVAGVEPGMHLWRLSLGGARDKLLDIPWVLEANLGRKFPNFVEISITERSPAAVVAGASQAWVIAGDGMVLAENTGYSLPWIRGLDVYDLSPGSRLTGQVADIALQYIEAYRPLEAHISDICFEGYPVVIILYTNDGFEVLFDAGTDPAERVLDLIALLQELRGARLNGKIDFRSGAGRGVFTPWPPGEVDNNN